MPFRFTVLLTAFAAGCATGPAAITSPGYKVVGYFTNWAGERTGCAFTAADVNPRLFTHINFAFAQADPGPGGRSDPVWRLSPFGGEHDRGPSGAYAQVNALKQRNPALRTLLSVGGWTHTDSAMAWRFTTLAASPASRAQFIDSAIAYVRENGFDGVDLDWEYPGDPERGGRPEDTRNFTLLLQEFRDAIEADSHASGRATLLLTVAMPAGEQARYFELGEVAESVDWINLMAYDYAGEWSPRTGMNSPNPPSAGAAGVQRSVQTYIAAGVPASKIVLGIPAYGRTYAGVSTASPGAPFRAEAPGARCTGEGGFISYFEVEEMLASGTLRRYWDEATATPYAYDAGRSLWVSYDDPESIARKVDVIERLHLGGAMVWAIDLDDYEHGYPLISVIARRLLSR